jgi:hypothetical protein
VHRLLIVVAAVTAVFVTSGTATTAAPSITLMPNPVTRGHSVVIKGSAGGCAAGNRVSILSKAFVHTHDFAGLPAVFAKVKANGRYRVTTKIPARKRPGRYRVTARCGGGNFGIVKRLRVRR